MIQLYMWDGRNNLVISLIAMGCILLNKRWSEVRIWRWIIWITFDKDLDVTQKKDPQYGPIRMCRLLAKEPWWRSSGQILQVVHHEWSHKRQMNQLTSISDHQYVERIDKYSISDHWDIIRIKNLYPYAQAAERATSVYVRISRLMRKIRILMHKPLNAQNTYTYAQAA